MREGLYVVFWIKGRNWYFSRCINNLPTSTATLGLAFSQTPSIHKAANRFKSLPSEQKQPYHVAEDHFKHQEVNRSKQTKIDGLFCKRTKMQTNTKVDIYQVLMFVCVCVYFYHRPHIINLSSIIRSNSKSQNQGLQSRKESKYLTSHTIVATSLIESKKTIQTIQTPILVQNRDGKINFPP